VDVLELARHHSGRIDILLTDVVMPGLRGPALARQVRTFIPAFTSSISGYAEGDVDQAILPKRHSSKKPFRFVTRTEQLKLLPRGA
jgi:two-component system cell cycle sensor histidine kinase/response regulator CckA